MWTRNLGRGAPALALLVLVIVAVGARAERGAPSTAPHLFSVPSDGPAAVALARTQARVVARYAAFTLVEAEGDDATRLRRAGADQRDDMREVRLGRQVLDPLRERAPLVTKRRAPQGPGLAVVQFVGPIKDAWLDRLRSTGVRVVTYMAENGYLVRGSVDELAAVGALVGTDAAVRAVVPFTAADKLGAGVRTEGRQRLAVQSLSGGDGSPARSRVDDLGRELHGTSAVGPFRTQYVELDAADATALARNPGVISIQPAPEPRLRDEVADQIVAGALTGPDPLVPTGPGYLAFYDGLGLGTSTFPFVVDVTDEGIDVGSTATGQADFHEGGNLANPSRIAYASDFTSDPDARDCGGHGTINASIIGGFNDDTGGAVEDAAGFNYGLGVAPRVQLGASKIFLCASGNFGLTGSITTLTSDSYTNGARIANHSWGANTAGAYVAHSQEFDALVRDAQPGPATPGNQEMVEVVAAGNAGSAANTVSSLGAAKNVIAVGAAESVRTGPAPSPPGTDGCGITNVGADDAHDIIGFSARGPTDDARIKPDVVGPGTHVTGTQPDAVGYNGSGVCTSGFPAGSTLYNMSSGTSHSAPVVTGMAALFREWFRQNRGGGTTVPSPALTKAALSNAATDLDGGVGAGGNVPNNSQGWGLGNLARVLDTGPRFFSDQQTTLSATGDEHVRAFRVDDPSKPVRVTLAWTDPPGPTVGNSFVNNLDLTVGAGAGTFKGNVFGDGVSAPGGTADPRNNLESVYLPDGTSGVFSVAVTAANIAGDGVPNSGDGTDQDFALVVSNAVDVTTPVFAREDTTIVPVGGDEDTVLEPGERFSVSQGIKNTGTAAGTGILGALHGPAAVTITDGSAAWPDLSVGQAAINSDGLEGRLDSGATCGAPLALTLAITSAEGASTTVPLTVVPGFGPATAWDSADVPKAIPDNNPAGVSSTLTVADSGVIQDVNVRVGNLTHAWVGDLKLELTSPTGTIVVLANRPGGTANSANDLTGTVFDDEANVAIGAGGTAAPYTGSFRPQADELSRFDGETQQGTWTLKVSDLAQADTGNLNAWGLDLAVGVCDFAPPAAPGQATGLVATAGADSVALDWDDTPSATAYEIYRRGPGGSYSSTPTATTTPSSFTDSGRTPGQEYCYKVGALNDAIPGPLSQERCATPSLPAGPQGPPGGPPGGPPVEIQIDLSGLPRSIRVSRPGIFVLSFLATPGQAGSLKITTVKAVAAARKRRLVVARKTFMVPAGGRARLKVRLTRKGLRVLKRVRRLPVSVKVTLGTRTASRRVTLRAPRPRR
ncbi:MAG TPA: S8 family serine peptidase [Thermoleophilaceae bacterium]